PPDEPRTPRAFFDAQHDEREFFFTVYGPEHGTELLALREEFERSYSYADLARYVEALQGPAYLPGLRASWGGLELQSLQLAALHRFVAHVAHAGALPVLVALPENPLFERDPEVGSLIRSRSDAIFARVRDEAEIDHAWLIDLRRGLAPTAFFDLNHLFYEH